MNKDYDLIAAELFQELASEIFDEHVSLPDLRTAFEDLKVILWERMTERNTELREAALAQRIAALP